MDTHTLTSASPRTRRSAWLVLGVVALVLCPESFRAPASAQSSGVSPWQERLLATVPSDGAPKTVQWDNWVAITDDLTHLAYLLRFPSGDRMRETYVYDGRRGPEFVFASRGALSPDGRHLAFIGIPDTAGLPACLVVGDIRIQIQFKDTRLGPTWIPVFSPDGRKVAFRAERPNGRYAIGVLDVDAASTDPAAAERHVTWGPDVLDVDRPAWAPDSSVVSYAAWFGNEWGVIVGSTVRAAWKDATGVTFSPSGAVAYQATDGRVHFVVVGDERHASFGAVSAPTFRGDGTVVYGATEQGRHYVVAGTRKHEVSHAAEGAAVSADGTRVMWWYWDEKRERMFINGEKGRKFTRVSSPVLDAEAGTFAYTAQDDRHFYVVTPRNVHTYDGVLWRPRISPDGTKVGFVAVIGKQLIWKVLPLP